VQDYLQSLVRGKGKGRRPGLTSLGKLESPIGVFDAIVSSVLMNREVG